MPARPALAADWRMFRPFDSEATLALRQRLSNAHTQASAIAATTPSPTAATILWDVTDLASRWLQANVDDEKLERVASALGKMFQAALYFEKAES